MHILYSDFSMSCEVPVNLSWVCHCCRKYFSQHLVVEKYTFSFNMKFIFLTSRDFSISASVGAFCLRALKRGVIKPCHSRSAMHLTTR